VTGDGTVGASPASATPASGLTAAQVAERRSLGLGYPAAEPTSRSVAEILRANILTRFNLILGTLLAVILAVGEPQDALFGIILVVNAVIGIAQELRAKRILDRLAVLTAPTAAVLRDGGETKIPVGELVTGDLVRLRSGDQLVADGVVRSASGLQADESLLTGESEPVDKEGGDTLLSGSFVVAGSGVYEAIGVGSQAYARRLATQARQYSVVRSELIEGTNRILRYVTWAIVPVAGLMVASQLHERASARDAVTGTVAALVGMVPQGLVLLTSIAFGVAALTLARRQVLVQQLPAVEGLARVDVVCLDKTGTLTDGAITFDRLIVLDDKAGVANALAALAGQADGNATMSAIASEFRDAAERELQSAVPFSSARKWSAASFTGSGTWVLGAPEIVLPDGPDQYREQASSLAAAGQRVLVLACTDAALAGQQLPGGLLPAAFVVLSERLRPDAAETIAFFAAQGVTLKVISGDSPHTVGAVAARAGIPGWEGPVDARELPDDPALLSQAMEAHSVFGRVAPHQKQAMVAALQARGHTVAMTGDGVNDVLALKLADIGVAMGSGTAATRAVAELVLLDGRFATLPGVVAEGRRVTANIERVANLFVTKSVWATLLAVAVAAAVLPYPFLPRHLTIIDSLTIGVPGFFLALAPNRRRYVPGFTGRVLRFAIPAGTVVAAAALAAYLLARTTGLPPVQQRTAAVLVAVVLGLAVVVVLALPMTWRRAALLGAMIAAFALLFPLPSVRRFYALDLPGLAPWAMLLICAAGSGLIAAIGVSRLGPPASRMYSRDPAA
jgi:cation-transporting ATPase E